MMENIEDSWFLRWDEDDVDLRKEREKLEDSGKKEMMRKVLIRGGFGPACFPGDQWEGSGSDTAREAGVLPSAGFISAFWIPGKPGCSNMGEESLREQKRSGRAWWRVASQLEVT